MIFRVLNKNNNVDKIYDIDLNLLIEGQTDIELLELYLAGDADFGASAYGNYYIIPNDGNRYIAANNQFGYELYNPPKTLEESKLEAILQLQAPIIIGEYSIPYQWEQDAVNAYILLKEGILEQINVPGTNLVFNLPLISALLPVYAAQMLLRRQKIVQINAATNIADINTILGGT